MTPITKITVLRRPWLACLVVMAGVSAAWSGERPLKGSTSSPDALYHNYCSVCHGDRGDGNSRARNSLVPPPRDFTRAPDLTRDTMLAVVTHGKSGTAMVAWTTQLDEKQIEAVVDYIRSTFMQIALDPLLQRGRSLYARNCMVCHGERGQGANAASIGPAPPRDFTTLQARVELTRERMIRSVTQGRADTAMAAFAGRLPAQDIEAVVDYVRASHMLPATGAFASSASSLTLPFQNGLSGNADKGVKIFTANCTACHGVKGDGNGPRAYFINPRPRNFIDPAFGSSFNRPAIFNAVSEGRQGTEMPAWSKVLDNQAIADVSEFVFQRFVHRPPMAKAAASGSMP